MKKMKEFEFKDIFETVPFRDGLQVPTGGRMSSKELKSGNTPRISVTSVNNGIIGYYTDVESKNYRVYTNCISVSFLGTVFYHPYRASFDMKVHCLKPKHHNLKSGEALYLVSCIKKLVCHNTYGNQTSSTDLPYMKISLPVKTTYIPDFAVIARLVEGVDISMSNIDTSYWKEFKLEELFSAESGDFDIKKEHINGLGIDVVTAGETKNGILGKSDIKAKVFDGNTITIDMFGKCTYRPDCYKMVTHARIFSLKCLFDDFDEKSGLYITAMLQKLVSGFNYSNMCSWNKIKDLSIKLPVKEVKEEIDWEYMQERITELEQERITELEQERITELEQYLIATGLNDYELTDEDKDILATKLTDGGVLQNSISGNGCLKEAKMFRVEDLFELQKVSNKLAKENLSDDYDYPAYSSDTSNNGIIGYTNKPEFICNEDVPVYIIFGDHTRTLNIARKSFSVLDNVKVLIPCCDNDKVLLYITSKWQKQIPNLGYARHWKMAKKCVLSLPIQTDANNKPIIDETNTYHPDGYIPDWEYMEKYIRAIEKVVIKDVVKYKDSVIERTKEIVAS